MIIITGGAGFIGSNLITNLNKNGIKEILIFDNLNKQKKKNLKNLSFKKIYNKNETFEFLKSNKKKIDVIFHLGACTNTLENNWDYLYKNNFEFTKKLSIYSSLNNIKLIYASSASVYGKKDGDLNELKNMGLLKPLNLYAKSKLLFDKFLIQNFDVNAEIIGLRYFNVYGNNEDHKLNMASPIHNFFHQIKEKKFCKIFDKFDGYPAGGHKRDFVSVDDCVKVNLWLFKKRKIKRNILNVGSGSAVSFKDVASIIINELKYGKIKIIKFPDELKKGYQSYTRANLSELRNIGYTKKFIIVSKGIHNFIKKKF